MLWHSFPRFKVEALTISFLFILRHIVGLGNSNISPIYLKYFYIEVVNLISKGQPLFNKGKCKLFVTMFVFKISIKLPLMANLGSPNISPYLKYIYIKIIKVISRGDLFLNKGKSKLSITMLVVEGFDDGGKEPTPIWKTLFWVEINRSQ